MSGQYEQNNRVPKSNSVVGPGQNQKLESNRHFMGFLQNLFVALPNTDHKQIA